MAEIINYIWQSSFCLLFFFGAYWCFLREEKAFTLTRVFVLIAPVMALLFPIIEIPVDFSKPSISLEHTEFLQSLDAIREEEEIAGTYGLPEFTVRGSKLPLLMELKDYFIIGYLVIVVLLGLRLFWQFLKLNMLLRKGWYQTIFKLKGDYFLVPTFGLAPVFSFLDKLFWDETQILRPDEKEHIIQHEIEHIRQKHSWDVIYYQVLSTLFWFNPAIHLMRSALVDTHEYLADARVLKRTDNKESYRKLIVKIAFKGLDLPIGNYFIRSTTLKRIMMMKKSSKINWFKLLMVLPLTAMLLVLVSMKTMPDPGYPIQRMTENIFLIKRQIIAAQDSIQVTTKVKKINSPVHYEYVSGLKNGKIIAQLGNLQYEIGDISNTEEYRKVLEMIGIFKGNSSLKKDYSQVDLEKETDENASPVGGMSAWTEFLSDNLKIPSEAKELGANGTVFTEFIVNKEGKILSPVIKKSLGMGLDDEVLRIMSLPTVPEWSPGIKDGKAVNTLMVLPVQFKSDKVADTNPFFPQAGRTSSQEGPQQVGLFNVVEQMPIPEGGMDGWNNYIFNHLKYPEMAKQAGIEGTVYVSFIVSKEGQIKTPQILRGIGGGADEEALRLVSASPKWAPGMQKGEKVNVRMRVPIKFKLPDSNGKESSSTAEETFETDSPTRSPGNLNEAVVIGYGSGKKEYISKNTNDKNSIEIVFTGEDQIIINGKKTNQENLKDELSNEAIKLNPHIDGRGKIIATIRGDESTKMSQIHDLQSILRTLGIRKVKYPYIQ